MLAGPQRECGSHAFTTTGWQAAKTSTSSGFNYNYGNPYDLYENTNSQDINRVFGNVALTYDLTDNSA